jgi:hypothetical protein
MLNLFIVVPTEHTLPGPIIPSTKHPIKFVNMPVMGDMAVGFVEGVLGSVREYFGFRPDESVKRLPKP